MHILRLLTIGVLASLTLSACGALPAEHTAGFGGGKADGFDISDQCTVTLRGRTYSIEAEYLPQVLACEMYDGAPAALRALAVAARSFVHYRLRHEGGAIEGTTRDQVFFCNNAVQQRHLDAVQQTGGQLIAYRGQLIGGFYRLGTPYLDRHCRPNPAASLAAREQGGQLCVTDNSLLRDEAVRAGGVGHAPDGRPLHRVCGFPAQPRAGNRGVMSQHGANCLAGGTADVAGHLLAESRAVRNERPLYGPVPEAIGYRDRARAYTYQQILKTYYGHDAEIVQGRGCGISACESHRLEHDPNDQRLRWLLDHGVLEHCDGQAWGASCWLSRARFVDMMARVLGHDVQHANAARSYADEQLRAAGKNAPRDVRDDTPYAASIWLGYAHGLTNGCSADHFCPDQFLTREQLATFVSRMLEQPFLGGESWKNRAWSPAAHFPDVKPFFLDAPRQEQSWSFAHIQKLYEAGLVGPRDHGRFGPKALVTVHEAASLLHDALSVHRALDRAARMSVRVAAGCAQPVDDRVATGFVYPVGDRTTWPAGGWRVTQVLGQVSHDQLFYGHHLGQDLQHPQGGHATVGQPVYSIGRGTVLFAKRNATSYRYAVLIRHRLTDGTSVCSFYGHLTRPLVAAGDEVAVGQQISTVSSWADCVAGASPAGSHLHYVVLNEALCAYAASTGTDGGTKVCGYDGDATPTGATQATIAVATKTIDEPRVFTSSGDPCRNHEFDGGFLSPTKFIDEHRGAGW